MALAIFKSPDLSCSLQLPDGMAPVQFVKGEAVVEDAASIEVIRAAIKKGGLAVTEVSQSDLENEAEKAEAHAAALKQLLILQQASASNGGATAKVGISTSANINAVAAESTAQVAGAEAANKALNKAA
jgi:hypothetical protein